MLRIVWLLSATALGASLFAAIVAVLMSTPDTGPLRRHIAWAMGSSLLVVLSHSWFAVFLFMAMRALRRERAEAAVAGRAAQGLWAALAAVVVTSAAFVVGVQEITVGGLAVAHRVLSWLALVAQATALVAELSASTAVASTEERLAGS